MQLLTICCAVTAGRSKTHQQADTGAMHIAITHYSLTIQSLFAHYWGLRFAEEAFAEGDWLRAEATLAAVVEALSAQSQYSEVALTFALIGCTLLARDWLTVGSLLTHYYFIIISGPWDGTL